MKKITIIKIENTHGCVYIELHNDKVIVAAPVLLWMKKRNMSEQGILNYCSSKHWKTEVTHMNGLFNEQ